MKTAIPTIISMLQLDSIEITDSNAHVVAAARARLVECQALVAIAERRDWPVSPRLMPLARAIDDSIMSVETLNRQPFDDDEHTSDRVICKEECHDALDQARIAGVIFVTHLERALAATLRSQAANPAADSTSG